MKFASFKINGTTSWGLIDGAEAVDLGALSRDRFPDLKSAIAAGALAEVAALAAKAARYPLANIAWLPVIPNPTRSSASVSTTRRTARKPAAPRSRIPPRSAASPTARPGISANIIGRGVEGSRFRGRTRRHHRQAGPVHLAQGRVGTSRDTPVTTKAASAIISATPINSRPARTFPRPARSAPGW